MKNDSIFQDHENLFQSFTLNPQSHRDEPDLLKFKKWVSSLQKDGSFKFSLLISFIDQLEQSLGVIKKMTNLSRGKFSDKTFESHFHRILQEEVEKVHWLLQSVLNYVRVNTAETKTNTVHTLLEESLKKHQPQWDKKKIRVFKKFEKDLPETTVPDEHLRYILESLLQYAVRWMPPNGFIGLMTRSVFPPKESSETDPLSIWGGKQIEISILFDGYSKIGEPYESVLRERPPTKKEPLDFELRLIQDMVNKNRGVMETATDEEKGRTYVSLKFPIERRKVLCYPSFN